MTKKIISFSLWGKKPVYIQGALRNAELTKSVFPGWISRFYTGIDVDKSVSRLLKDSGAEVVDKPFADWRGMFWRFEPASEEGVDIMICRDCDSRLSLRDKAAVDEWLVSGNQFHIIRDHPQHCTTILGGLWGCRNNILKDIKLYMNNWKQEDRWQTDQEFLNAIIYPKVKCDAFVHDEFHHYEISRHKINYQRENFSFLGEHITELEQPNLDHRYELAQWLSSKNRNSS